MDAAQNALTEFLKRRWIDAELAKSREEEVDRHHQHQTPPPLPLLPHELHELILMSLPAKSLLRLQLVCKKWFNLINTSFFIQANAHAHQFDTLLISRSPTSRQSIVDGRKKFWFHLLSLEDGGSSFVDRSQPIEDVRASCDGLIIACDKYWNPTFTLLNPLTRQKIELPTPVSCRHYQELFGMAYCNEARSYKVVHAHRRGYEILTVGSGKWRSIKGPNESIQFLQGSVSIGGSLHWLSISRGIVSCTSMNVCDETFVRVPVPAAGAKRVVGVPVPYPGKKRVVGYKLVEIDGDLGYMAHAEANNLLLHVWILTRGCWTFKYNIRTTVVCVPICCRRKGKDLVLESSDDHRMYAYDLERDELNPIITPGCDDEQPVFEYIDIRFFPHRHTLVPVVSSSSTTFFSL